MRKVASILLLGLLLFNWVGFRLYSSYMEEKANRQLEAQLDNDNYDESQLITVKVPAGHLSSYTLSTKFERVDGQVEVNGVLYKYVKRRVFNDTIEMLCIPNHQAMKVQTAKENFFKLVNDLQHDGQSKKGDSHSNSSKSFSPDYNVNEYSFALHTVVQNISKGYHSFTENLSSVYSLTAEQPPEHC
ncbi:MAG: hypothetical protein JST96_13740 [Bacteroidetes bacterium]|nr:hypothetical protein [Bacteroidota bacterium]